MEELDKANIINSYPTGMFDYTTGFAVVVGTIVQNIK